MSYRATKLAGYFGISTVGLLAPQVVEEDAVDVVNAKLAAQGWKYTGGQVTPSR